ncbi:hypothetical protein U14_01959 [Candidatus Moduliflexus flocculans]|uniref:DUF1559 domain-containing protein n=1 Tax=Candidatus Moduliflexus flocculans TaxID=1499966 RepID=A0A0S6VZ22_9BACT|nr:hypothetical protein U14_01959 [Candidatus Moduliflexus flocculans]
MPVGSFKCASFGGDPFSVNNPNASASGIDTPYGVFDSQSGANIIGGAAIGNYVALGATHSESLLGSELDPYTGGAKHPNGVIYPGGKTSIRDIVDGTTNTLIACETKEITLAAWFDGATAAVVGLVVNGNTNSPVSFTKQTVPPTANYGIPTPLTGTNKVVTTLNYGDDSVNPPKQYLTTGPDGLPWVHGPSSEHPGVVNHLLGDASVRSVSETLDTTLYMHLITRAGKEPVNEFNKE